MIVWALSDPRSVGKLIVEDICLYNLNLASTDAIILERHSDKAHNIADAVTYDNGFA